MSGVLLDTRLNGIKLISSAAGEIDVRNWQAPETYPDHEEARA